MSKKVDYTNASTLDEESDIFHLSFKEVLKKLKNYWKFFMIAPIVGIGIAIVIYLSTVPKYESKVMILLNVEDDGSSAFKSLQELVSSYNPRLMYENEVVIMKSNTLCLRTIESYDYEVSYFKQEFLRKTEITFNSPIKVVFDKNKHQLLNTDFIIFDIDTIKKSFRLKVNFSENSVFNYTNLKSSQIPTAKKVINEFNNKEQIHIFDQWIETELFRFKVELLSNNHQLDKIIFKFNNPFQLANRLSQSLSFNPTAKESSGVDVTIKSNTPEKTDFLLRRHINEYEKLGKELKNENIIKTLNFINNQLSLLQDSLRSLESKIQRVRAANLIIDSKGQGSILIKELFELDKKSFKLKMTGQFLYSVISSSDFSADGINALPQLSGIQDPILLNLIQKFNLLKIQRQRLGYMNDNNPIISQLNNEIKSTLLLIKSNAESLLRKNEEEIRLNNIKIKEVESKLSEIPGLELNILSIERNYKILENIFTFFLYKKSEMEISINFNKSNILFIDYLNYEPKKISPILLVNIALGGIGSFGLTLLFIAGIILSKNAIDEMTNFETFSHLNILGFIPHNKYPDQNVIITQPQSIIAESFRVLRTKVKFFKHPDENCIVILITSFVPGEGKSFCSLNLASILALSGKKVLLVGADMRKPKLYDDLKAKNSIGLSTYLSGHSTLEESIQSTNVDNLYLISAGPIPPNPSELIITKNFEALMLRGKKSYDYIVIDSPPLMAVNDANEIMNFSDLNLIVVRKNVTQINFLKNLDDRIKKNLIRNAGVILNDFDDSSMAAELGYQLKGYGYIAE